MISVRGSWHGRSDFSGENKTHNYHCQDKHVERWMLAIIPVTEVGTHEPLVVKETPSLSDCSAHHFFNARPVCLLGTF